MKQCASEIMMITPDHFMYNPETAVSNAFQKRGETDQTLIRQKALEEFYGLAELLQKAGIEAHIEKDSPDPHTPDAVFPNNWIMFHQTGDISLFPMAAPSRRHERRIDIIDKLREKYKIGEIRNYSYYEKEGKYLEGTGSMVFDHINKVAYACLSPRTHPEAFTQFCRDREYEAFSFHATDPLNREIYHTNVMMSIGEKMAIICSESIKDHVERKNTLHKLQTNGFEMIEISFDQMNSFAGNMLQLANTSGENFMVMSTQAYNLLNTEQVKTIEKYSGIIHSPLDTIEYYGGGSARCMIAEVFLTKK